MSICPPTLTVVLVRLFGRHQNGWTRMIMWDECGQFHKKTSIWNIRPLCGITYNWLCTQREATFGHRAVQAKVREYSSDMSWIQHQLEPSVSTSSLFLLVHMTVTRHREHSVLSHDSELFRRIITTEVTSEEQNKSEISSQRITSWSCDMPPCMDDHQFSPDTIATSLCIYCF